MFNKYYRKTNDVDTSDSFKHLIWGVMLWMI